MSLESKLTELDKAYQAKRESLIFEESLRPSLPKLENGEAWSLFKSDLYGVSLWASLNCKKKSMSDICKILEQVTDLCPMINTRGTFTSFKPAFYVSQMDQEKRERDHKTEVECLPFRIKVTLRFDASIEVYCFINGKAVRLSLDVPTHTFGSYQIRRQNKSPESRILSCDFNWSQNVWDITQGQDTIGNGITQRMWSSDGASDFYMSWQSITHDSAKINSLTEMLRSLGGGQ